MSVKINEQEIQHNPLAVLKEIFLALQRKKEIENYKFLTGEPVASIESGQIKPDEQGRYIKSAVNWFKGWLEKNNPSQEFENKELGTVIIAPSGIKSAMSHKPKQIDIEGLPALPLMIDKAVVLSRSGDNDGKPIENIVVAAPIRLDNQKCYMVVRLKRHTEDKTSKPRFYTQAITIEEGIKKGNIPSDQVAGQNNLLTQNGGRFRLINILHHALSVNMDGFDGILTKEGADHFHQNLKSAIDKQAHQAATSPLNDLPEPSPEDILSGNYQKGLIKIDGLDIAIENPAGSIRKGVDVDGKQWQSTMQHHYGYIVDSKGFDGDELDVFVKSGLEQFNGAIYVIKQVKSGSDEFDEHKLVIGAESAEEAKEIYLSNYDQNWQGFGSIHEMSMDELKSKLGRTWNEFDSIYLESGEINLDLVTEITQRNALDVLRAIYSELLAQQINQVEVDNPDQGTRLNLNSIQDLGEKIGGARKDTAMKGMKKSRTSAKLDSRPAWMRRFNVVEVVSGHGAGTWEIIDNRKKHWAGGFVTVARGFSNEAEAEMAIPLVAVSQKHRIYRAGGENRDKFAIYRNINDRKRVQIVETLFDTDEEAKLYIALHAKEIIETNTTFGEVDIPKPDDTVRKGPQYRKDNADGQDFMDTFGLRGVEFGNWNNQAERQELLNDAYDGLMDLSNVLGISPKAISLNGDLALAFGARGQGLSGAAAHYERSRAVINLTKKNGAGSLAHEWLHAFDHYMGRLDGGASSDWDENIDGTRSLKIDNTGYGDFVSHGFSRKSNIDPEIIEAHQKLMTVLKYKDQQVEADVEGANKFVAEAKERVEKQLNAIREYLLKQLDPKYYKRLNKPASENQIAIFDQWAVKILSGEMLDTVLRDNPNSRSSWSFRQTNDALDAINDLMKSIRGRQGFSADGKGWLDSLRRYMSGYQSRLKMLDIEQSSETKSKRVPTDFVMDASRLDSGRLGNYWQLETEMLARAFQGYIEDKIKAHNGYSPFLNYGPEGAAILTPWGASFVFPRGEERQKINQAFDELFEVMRRKGVF